MEQKPMAGEEALTRPDPAVAELYLQEVGHIERRRDERIDRTAWGWTQLANAVVTAVFLTLGAAMLREGSTPRFQMALVMFLVWGQVAAGLAERAGFRWPLGRRTWVPYLASGVLLIVTLIVFGIAAFGEGPMPPHLLVLPGLLVLLGFGGAALVQMKIGRRQAPSNPPARAPLSRASRTGTIALGVFLGIVIALIGLPEDPISQMLLVMVYLLLVAWMLAGRSDLGVAALAAVWRWPVFVALAVAGATVVTLVSLDAWIGSVAPSVTVLCGSAVAMLFVAVSFVRGYDR
ncbi:MAG: hypothetical protein ACQEW8_00480 [Actinomycetota bacterium]